MYHDRYGPTCETLAAYMKDLWGKAPSKTGRLRESTTIKKSFDPKSQTISKSRPKK
jgi:hypothetical protein